MKVYYEIKTNISILVDNGKIVKIQKKPLFKYDELIVYGENRHKYGVMGTVYHSGKSVNHAVRFENNDILISNLNENPIGILENYSVCDSVLDINDFVGKNFYSFYTSETEIMPALGYVIKKEGLRNCEHSWYEQKNVTESQTSLIDCDENLDGDNLGQMAQLVCAETPVYNKVCSTLFKNPFYNKTLSISKLKGIPTVCMNADIYKKYIKAPYPLRDLAFCYPVPMKLDSNVFGYDECNVFITSPEFTRGMSHFNGFIELFSKKEFFYSYEDKQSSVVAYWNRIVNEH